MWFREEELATRGRSNPLQYSFLENSHGQRSQAGYSPWGHKESDTTKRLSTAQSDYMCVLFGFINTKLHVHYSGTCISPLASWTSLWVNRYNFNDYIILCNIDSPHFIQLFLICCHSHWFQLFVATSPINVQTYVYIKPVLFLKYKVWNWKC